MAWQQMLCGFSQATCGKRKSEYKSRLNAKKKSKRKYFTSTTIHTKFQKTTGITLSLRLFHTHSHMLFGMNSPLLFHLIQNGANEVHGMMMILVKHKFSISNCWCLAGDATLKNRNRNTFHRKNTIAKQQKFICECFQHKVIRNCTLVFWAHTKRE